jgi:hypothetical protein
MVRIPSALRYSPSSILIRSAQPEYGNAVAFVVAHSVNPQFVALEIRRPGPSPPGRTVDWSRLLDPVRHFVTNAPTDLVPRPGVDSSRLVNFVGANQPGESLPSLQEFLEAPEIAQRVVGRFLPVSGVLPLVLLNGDLITAVYPRDPAVRERQLRMFTHLGYTIITTGGQTPQPGHDAFDWVFDLDAYPEKWGAIAVRCTKAPAQVVWQAGDLFTLESVEDFLPSLRSLG